jgi:hypothetical protein
MNQRESAAWDLAWAWQEKGDLENTPAFDREYIAKEFPALLKAWDDYQACRAVLDAVVRDIKRQ